MTHKTLDDSNSDNASTTGLYNYSIGFSAGFNFTAPKRPPSPDPVDELVEDIGKIAQALKKVRKALACTIL